MKEKIYSFYGKATDKNGRSHYVTVVGRFMQEKVTETIARDGKIKVDEFNERDGKVIFDYRYTNRSFTMARSICDPRDTFDEEVGKNIALRRIKRGDIIGELNSRDITMLNEDMCEMILLNELKHSIENIDKFID